MKKVIGLLLLGTILLPLPAGAQRLLSLDSCRSMALRNNKQLSISKVKQDVAANLRKAARTKYLPSVNAYGTYQYTSREISLLSDEQKSTLSTMGTTTATGITSVVTQDITAMVQQGALSLEKAQTIGQMLQSGITPVAQTVDAAGQKIVDAFHTDTRNIFGAAIMVQQPIFMGGRITALNKMADYSEIMAQQGYDARQQSVLYDIDNAYWTVVSLKHKQKLADGYLALVKKLDDDVQKMIREGVATKSDGLKVDVKVNEVEMMKTKVDNGLSLAKMYLSQLCGLPVSDDIILADENKDTLEVTEAQGTFDVGMAVEQRPELQMLQTTIGMTEQTTKMMKADYLPMVALTGGYLLTNPNIYNGYANKFGGVWNVGVLLRIPIWNWGETADKIRAAKGATTIAKLELDEAKEKIELQLNQNSFKVAEANKKYATAVKNTEKAEENLRCANLGFREGVMNSTVVMEALTAWLQAQSDKIDAAIDIKLTELALKKSMGDLKINN